MIFTRPDTMLPRERVLASLKREPVDRISYYELGIDLGVAVKAAGGIDKLRFNQEILKSRKDSSPSLYPKNMCLEKLSLKIVSELFLSLAALFQRIKDIVKYLN